MSYSNAANSSGYNERWHNNTVLLGPTERPSRGQGYIDFPSCSPKPYLPNDAPLPALANNTIFLAPDVSPSTFTVNCGPQAVPYSEFVQGGHDVNTNIQPAPSSQEEDNLVALARELLQL
eukprot:m.4917 g.4917  ORF g.4917 m.4917 type:complete len:120 (+) comp3824_c0_seq2:349-708(+)